MPKDQKVFTKEFKVEAVQLVQKSGKSQAQIARDLGIADSTLHHWCKEYAKAGEQAFVFCKGKVYQFLLEKCARRTINKNRFQPKNVPHVTRKVYHPLSLEPVPHRLPCAHPDAEVADESDTRFRQIQGSWRGG